jgi:taurine dioxygenase
MKLLDLPGTIGTEVLGVDLAAAPPGLGWSAGEIDSLRETLDRRHLLLVRGSAMSGESQVAFAARFGPLVAEGRLCGYVSNARDDGIVREGALLFHSDFAFTAAPVEGIALHALEVPGEGSPTRFADTVRGAAALPADLRARLMGRSVVNVYDFRHGDDRRMRLSDVDPRSPRWAHSVLGRHPRTGEEVVLANELHSDHLVGVSSAESEALLKDLFAVLYDGAHVLEHRWSVGDLVLWDNVALHHGRPDFPKQARRTLQRVTIGRYTANELVPNLAELLA